MSAWTKGPWEWHVQDASMMILGQPGCDAGGGDSVMAATRCRFCAGRVDESGDWGAEYCYMPNPENARLIASAPDLAAALDDLGYTSSELLYAADHDTGGAAVESWLGALRESMERARAALAKAKGE